MARTTAFTKRSLISKANSAMVLATTIAAFVVVFTLVAGKSLVGQMGYQNRVIDAKKTALKHLKDDLNARNSLEQSYNSFTAENPNVLGGDSKATGDKNGDNAKIVLDALPSRYDFPALTTSLEKIINDQNLKIMSISGTDEEATQSANATSPNPQPIAMPFQIQVNGSYQSVQNLVDVMQRSIRPFQIQTLELSGDQSNMIARIAAQTYYQPEKNLNITSKVVK
ncbi:MAG TPA: type 4a pilus biogenesis protein PilO [Patescibacteria group bacterium]|nr:type 4a pilus biogenesis protein PilO [Patescibacteria group bacterium]